MAAENPYRVAEAVADEAATLEAMLHEAVELKKRRMVDGDFSQNEEYPVYGRFDSAVANYGVQLRAWVDLQVDARLHQVLPVLIKDELGGFRHKSDVFQELVGVELTDAHQHIEDAIEETQQLKAEFASAASAHARMVSVVQGMSEELARLHAAVATDCEKESQHACDVSAHMTQYDEELTSLRCTVNEAVSDLTALQDLPVASMETRREVGELIPTVQEIERRLSELREGVAEVAKLDQDVSKISALYGDLEARVENLDAGVSVKMLESRLRDSRQELRTQIEESNARLTDELIALQQKYFTKLQAETSAISKSVSGKVNSLDQQLWRTDQHLSQRIDELMHLQLRDTVEYGHAVRSKLVSLVSPRNETSADIEAPDKVEAKQRQAAVNRELGNELSPPVLGRKPPSGALAMASLAGKAFLDSAQADDDERHQTSHLTSHHTSHQDDQDLSESIDDCHKLLHRSMRTSNSQSSVRDTQRHQTSHHTSHQDDQDLSESIDDRHKLSQQRSMRTSNFQSSVRDPQSMRRVDVVGVSAEPSMESLAADHEYATAGERGAVIAQGLRNDDDILAMPAEAAGFSGGANPIYGSSSIDPSQARSSASSFRSNRGTSHGVRHDTVCLSDISEPDREVNEDSSVRGVRSGGSGNLAGMRSGAGGNVAVGASRQRSSGACAMPLANDAITAALLEEARMNCQNSVAARAGRGPSW